MNGIAAVQSRIAELESRIQAVAGPRPGLPAAAAGLDFAAALSGALAGSGEAAAVSGGAVSALSGATGGSGPAIVAAATRYLGVPYVWGGEDTSGMDCSGLVQRTLADLGVAAPRTAREQASIGVAVPSLAQARPGDLIVTRGGGHIGIYLGDNRIIHAPRPGEKVSVRALFETDADIHAIRRVQLPATTAPGVDLGRLAIELAAAGGR